MNKRNLCIAAVIAAGLIGGASAAHADAADRYLALQSRFELDDGDTLAVNRAEATRGYRICMEDAPGAVPLRVKYEGKELLVAPGECRLVESKSVRLSSAARLRGGMTLLGTFNASATRALDADTRVARLARED